MRDLPNTGLETEMDGFWILELVAWSERKKAVTPFHRPGSFNRKSTFFQQPLYDAAHVLSFAFDDIVLSGARRILVFQVQVCQNNEMLENTIQTLTNLK